MYTTNLRKVGGSVMLAVPPVILEMMAWAPGTTVGLAVEGDRLIVDAKPRRRYSLSELLAASDFSQPQSPEEREWIDAPPVGRELI